MKKWIQNKSFMFSLLVGSLAIIIVVGLVWQGAMMHFLRLSDAAIDLRLRTDHLDMQFLEARRLEKDFLLRDLANAQFHEKGESKSLTEHAVLMASLSDEVDGFVALTHGGERERAVKIRPLMEVYTNSFKKLAAAYREKGYNEWGVAGAWRAVINDIETHLDDEKYYAQEVILLQLRRSEKDYLLRGDAKYVDEVHAELKELAASIKSSGIANAEALLTNLEKYGQLFDEYLVIEERIGKTEEDGLRGEMRHAVNAVHPLLVEIAEQAAHESEQARELLKVASLWISLGGLLLAGLFFYFLAKTISTLMIKLSEVAGMVGGGDLKVRMDYEATNELGVLARGFNRMVEALVQLVGHVQRSGIQVNTSVNEIAATAKQQQTTANEVAATTTEIGATAKEITATSMELVKTVHEVTEVAGQTATLATDGQSGLNQMEKTMEHVMEAGASINAKLAVLNEKAGNINQVVTTITKVADQTNLLSLNAAIEAEKAGEHGRGFAVVATEIRRLADQTAVATYDIEQMVKEMLSAVSAGVMGMDKFSEEVRRGVAEVHQVGGQLGQIIQQVQELTPRFEVVNEGMQAQSTGAQQISDALAQLGEAAQQTAESLRQSSEAIEQLNSASQTMKSSVEKFKLS